MVPASRPSAPSAPGPVRAVPAAASAAPAPPPRPAPFMASSTTAKRMIYAAWGLAAVAAVLAVLDLALPQEVKPFGGQTVMDVLFLLAAALVGYLGFDGFKDIR